MAARGARAHEVDDLGVHRLAAACGGGHPRRARSDDALAGARRARGAGRRPLPHDPIGHGDGVSSGIDMALHLAALEAGDTVAQAIQLGIEYDPDPPHDTGSLEKAPAKIVEMTGIALAAEDGRAAVVHSLV